MCYAIPGKVVELNGRMATVDYYGERKKAYADLTETAVGDYVYAQGGFIIQTVPEPEAREILADWKELFFRLQQTDQKLANNPRSIYERANAVRQKHQGNSCCVHGILEFSNYCKNNCLYCGIRKDNQSVTRYRMTQEEILESVGYAVNKLGFKALVLQSGEDPYYDEDKLESIVREIRARYPVLIFVSIGERPISTYLKMYQAGARGALIRFETANPDIYAGVKPGSDPAQRIKLIKDVGELGYLIITGFLVGLPGEMNQDIIRNIKLTGELTMPAQVSYQRPMAIRWPGDAFSNKADPIVAASAKEGMFSFGPFIAHPRTPLAETPSPKLSRMLNTIAHARLMYPEARILVTTALETLDTQNGAREGLMAGANSLMINITPIRYRRLYEIYPDRAGADDDIPARIDSVLKLLYSLGRAPTDIGI